MIRFLVILGLVFFSQSLAANAQDRWVRVAIVQVVAGQEDVQFLDAWRWKGRYKAIRWQADRGTTSLGALAIFYSNCRAQLIHSRSALRSNDTVLEHPDSFVDGVVLSVNKSKRTRTLELWGLQSKAGAAAVRATVPLRAGFQIDFSVGRQVVHGCPDPRNHSDDQIQLQASVNDVYIESLKITYETDQTELIEIDANLRVGAKTEIFRLKGGGQFRQLELAYRPNFKGAARVDLHISSSPELLEMSGRVGPPDPHVCYFPCGPPEACIHKTTCTPIMVFFGTNRERSDQAERVGFGPERGQELSLGRAIVTVPKYHGIGKVERPSYWSAILSRHLMLSWRLGEDPERHFTIPRNGIEIFDSPQLFVEAMRSTFVESTGFRDHAFIYVHGFKVEFDDALFRLAQMAYDLGVDRNNSRIPFGMPFLFSWPARGGLLDYVTDKESAQLAESHLRSFLELVVTQSKAKHVHLVAHSMGNQPVLNVLTQIAAVRPDIKFNQIVLAAPDVDRKQFAEIALRVQAVAQNVTLYASSRDEAMLVSRRLHSGLPRAGDVPSEGPVVVRGVDTIDVSGLSTELFTASHSKYAEDTLLLKEIGALLREGVRPPHDRTPVLRYTPMGAQEFWVYRK